MIRLSPYLIGIDGRRYLPGAYLMPVPFSPGLASKSMVSSYIPASRQARTGMAIF